ncbi:MAG: hypothetical protein LBQ50_02010 [Planctomycetaceae bacterium]|jgi:hypothetical protein|nr:hypothetical protein [Planctomycetaceae bacterium]
MLIGILIPYRVAVGWVMLPFSGRVWGFVIRDWGFACVHHKSQTTNHKHLITGYSFPFLILFVFFLLSEGRDDVILIACFGVGVLVWC